MITLLKKIASLAFLLCCCSGDLRAESKFIRNNKSDTVIVFVHGVVGNSLESFTNGKTYWPDLLTQDSDFDGVDIFALDYPTTLWATLSVDELADVVRREMTGHQVDSRQNIIFLVH